MTTKQPEEETTYWMYVVTCLVAGEDPCSPRIVGVYSNLNKAVKNARIAFEHQAQYYRDGAFLPPSQVTSAPTNKIGRIDMLSEWSSFNDNDENETLLDFSSSHSVRVLAEVLDMNHWKESVVMAISKVSLNEPVTFTVPLLSRPQKTFVSEESDPEETSDTEEEDKINDKVEVLSLANNSKVHILMSAYGPDGWGFKSDVNLIGAYDTIDKAVDAALEDEAIDAIKEALEEEHGEVDDEFFQNNTEAAKKNEHGNMIMFDSDGNGEDYGIAMDTLVLDQDYDAAAASDYEEMDFKIMGSGIWMRPKIDDVNEVEVVPQVNEKKRPSSPPASTSGMAVAGLNKNDTNSNKENATNGSKKSKTNPPAAMVIRPCAECKIEKSRDDFSKSQWKKRPSRCCKVCIQKRNDSKASQPMLPPTLCV